MDNAEYTQLKRYTNKLEKMIMTMKKHVYTMKSIWMEYEYSYIRFMKIFFPERFFFFFTEKVTINLHPSFLKLKA